MRGLAGKTALVTGGSSGLGEAVVLRLAEEGASVAVAGRDAAKARAVAERAAALAAGAGHEGRFPALVGDVRVVADCERLVAEAVAVEKAVNPPYYDAAGEPKELWVAPGAGHTGGFRAQPEEYERRVTGFFDRYLLGEE